ncbi:signal recognition particle protein [bacterium]|nr:signal recognition particle protein [bacterium]
MFESLSERLGEVFKKLRGRGKLSENDINEALREVRRALLEADVNLAVVKEFVAKIKERAMGEELMRSMTPGQQVIMYVRDELIELMGSETAKLNFAAKGPSVFMMCGLHGAGKTTSSAKLANYLKSSGRQPMLVATDIYRPAAVQQLEVLSKQVGVPIYKPQEGQDPVEITRKAVDWARDNGRDVVIVDTAGRLTIDEQLMDELRRQKEAVNPQEVIIVVDAMTGQDAVSVAKEFHTTLGLTGVIMTKLDGDARGGAALSVRHVTGAPLKFIGVGEKISGFEPFHPDRMAGRILGMGDVLTLIEKAEEAIDKDKAMELEAKLRKNKFDLDDLLGQMQQIRRLGPLQDIIKMLPGIGSHLKDMPVDDKQIKRVEAIIQSMTPMERRNPEILDASRKQRIAAGCGSNVAAINQLLNLHNMMCNMMKSFGAAKGGKAPQPTKKKNSFRLRF